MGGFSYDGFGRRTSTTVGVTTTGHVNDGANLVQELSGGTPSANMLMRLGIDGAFSRTDSSGTSSFMTDALGSTLALADGSGTVQTSYTYDPFGNPSSTGASSGNTQQYTGRETDGTGLQYNRARYYSPTLQRCISEDPLGFGGGDVNLYAYAGNDPINATDPSGNCPWCAVAAVGAIVGGIVGAGTSFGTQLVIDKGDVTKIDYRAVAIAGAVGAATGALAPFVATSQLTGAVLYGGANIVQYAATAWATKQHVTKTGIISSAVTGAVAGGVAGSFAKPVGRYDNSLFKLDENVLHDQPWFDLQDQILEGANLARGCAASVISNTDWSAARKSILGHEK